MIVKDGRHWLLVAGDGRILGRHATKHAAKSQEFAIEIAKARRSGKRIRKAPARHLRGGQWERLYGKRRR